MDNKINLQILKSFRDDYQAAFEETEDTKKIEFISKLLAKFESYKRNRIFNLNVSPFIEDPATILSQLKQLREDCLNFLARMADLEIDLNDEKGENRFLSGTARILVGICYEHGILGLPCDGVKALNFYESAGRLKIGWAYFRQALCYEKGIGTPRNLDKCLSYYRISAKMGYIEALHVYGAIFLYGHLGEVQDIPNGIFFLSVAAKKATPEYPYAFFDLGQFYEGKINDKPEDLKYALELYTIGADKNCPNCLYRMGMALEFGQLGRKKKMSRAVFYYNKGAENGHKEAQMAMATFYLTGLPGILEKNEELAYDFALKSAIQGTQNAAFLVAECLEKGIGVKVDVVYSLWWYVIASSLGHKKAKDRTKSLKIAIGPKKGAGFSIFGKI